jgi:hypothetical protein
MFFPSEMFRSTKVEQFLKRARATAMILMRMALDSQFQYLCAKCTASGDFLLGLAFSLDTPLKHMRRDVADLMYPVMTFDESMTSADDRLEQSLQLTEQPMSQPDPPDTAKTVLEGWQIEYE